MVVCYQLKAENKLMPRKILCPVCGNRYYPTRPDHKKYNEDRIVEVYCSCGAWYQVINKGRQGIIRLRRG